MTSPDAHYPVALLPLRLETRFAGSLLRVRLYPDEIFADTHETGLTDDEARDGAAYVAAIGAAGEAANWAAMVSRYGAPRGAWIALASSQGLPAARASSWTRAAQALLPDSWVVRAYQGGTTFTAAIANVRQPLALTVSPTRGTQVPLSDTLTIDADLEWTMHFDAAVAAGMAVEIDLTKPDLLATGAPPPIAAGLPVDVVVVGVVDQAPDAGASQLHELLDAQHYTRGIAFPAPGTPTSNTDAGPAGYPVADPGGIQSFAVERQAPLATSGDGSDGSRFAAAFGLAPNAGEKLAVVEHVDGAARTQEAGARAMNGALWPATLGYFMQQMMAPKFTAADIEGARQYFLANVRPGGPLPLLRAGRVPYGVLPAVSLTRYAPAGTLPNALRALRDAHFLPAAANVPRVTPGSADPDGDLLKTLAIDAAARTVRMRILLGHDVTTNTAGLLDVQPALAAALQARAATASSLLGTVGLDADVRLGHVDPGADQLLNAPLVTGAPLSETAGVDYIQALIGWASATPIDFASIRDDKLPGTERPLLYRLLRHALLLEMDRVSIVASLLASTTAVGPRPIIGIVPVTTVEATRNLTGAVVQTGVISTISTIGTIGTIGTVGQVGTVDVAIVASADLAEPELVNLGGTAQPTAYDRIASGLVLAGFRPALGEYLGFLETLATLPSAELERRFAETLDACAHRLDAWITSLATERLSTLRATAATGCHVGGFGWVENLRPASSTPPAAGAAPQAGYIHAPSAAQASTAAILRNGYLSRGGGGSPYAVELGSTRTRRALELIDGTRQGEPLAALLGLRFERLLHDAQLDKLIAGLRTQFPLVAGRTPDGAGAVELVAASTVIDGLALRAAAPQPAGLSATDQAAFQKCLAALDDVVDGVADVLTAEAVFQAVRGNPHAATASLDALAQGTLPPEIDVVRTPGGGAAFTQRVALVLDGSRAASTGATPRSAAEPALDAWVAGLLGDATRIGCRVVTASGVTQDVTLSALGLGALDVLALAKTPPTGAGNGELDRRVLAASGLAAGTLVGARVAYDSSAVDHSFAECLEFARVIGLFVAGARALQPSDLVAPADSPSVVPDSASATQASGRAQAALASLQATTNGLAAALAPVSAALGTSPSGAPSDAQLAALRGALQEASLYGVSGAYPDPVHSASDLAASATSIVAEAAARIAAAPPMTAADAATLIAQATNTVQAIFGRDFRLLASFVPATASTLASALGESPALVGDANQPRRVVQQMARVRAGLDRWRSVFLYAEALGASTQLLDVAQLPTGQPTWAAAKGAAPAAGTLSLILHRPTTTAPTAAWAGLVADEWNELIPAATQPTAIAFRHETPVAEAPQVVLLAVPPTLDATTWDTDTLLDTVRETLTLAKLRLVDSVDELRPFLPAICLTGNTANETVSTDFLGALIAEPVIVTARSS
jgi:hypothetical protein